MFKMLPYVFVRITIVFIAGILLAIYFPNTLPVKLVNTGLIILAILYFTCWLVKTYFQLTSNLGWIGLCFVFFVGYALVYERTESNKPSHIVHVTDSIKYYKVVLNGYIQNKKNSWKAEAKIIEYKTDEGWSETSSSVLLFFSKHDFSNAYSYGDILLIKGSPKRISPPRNPEEFDYKKYLSYKNIYHQHILKKENVMLMDRQVPSTIMNVSIQVRNWAEHQLSKNVPGQQEQSIAHALVLGITDGMDTDILQAYAATGTLHVLAVSGLHVAIIYFLIVLVLKPFAKSKSGEWGIAILSLVLLWLYAFITGLSPSVLRAVTMFSFVALAKPLHRQSSIYNTIAVSAFCLLLYDPYFILSVGFQLSYLAVIGIVMLNRPLYLLWVAPTWVADKAWQLITVSIAAQVATLPIGLLYFHQFPTYFLLSNLLVIPISSFVLILGLMLLATSFIAPLAAFVGKLLSWSIQLMNISVEWIETWPVSIIDSIYINTFQSALIFLSLSFLFLFIYTRRFILFLLLCISIVVFSFVDWLHFTHEAKRSQLVVYSIPGHKAIELTDKGDVYHAFDSLLLKDTAKVKYHITPNRIRNRIQRIAKIDNQSFATKWRESDLYSFGGKFILAIHTKNASIPSASVDFVIISQNAVSYSEIRDKLSFTTLILDSSNSYYFADKLMKAARENGEDVHSVLHQGAFIHYL